MKQKRNNSGEALLTELRQSQNINNNKEFLESLDEINLNQDDAGSLDIDMTNEHDTVTTEQPIAPTEKDHNDPLVFQIFTLFLLFNVAFVYRHFYRRNHSLQNDCHSSLAFEKEEKVMMELDGHGQGQDNGANLLVRFLGVMARRATLCPISIQRWDQMPEDNTKSSETILKKKFWQLRLIQIYLPLNWWLLCIITRILRQRNNACKIEKIEKNFKYHMLVVVKAMPEEQEKMLGRPVCQSKVMLSTLVKKNENYVNGGYNLAASEQILEHLPEDQEHTAAEGVLWKMLAHLNDVIEKVFGAENVGRFGKSKHIFGLTTGGVSSNVFQQHVETLEKKLDGYEETKIQLATLHKFLLSKYGDEVLSMSGNMPDI
ncbi:hypothetical protein Ahy_A07g033016 [Arachis hypogaea]|uniref:Uncharacterized protein n=1 Tax=Arachis hypogaea TaxID=3818 RepID=A0A445C806_ARAHY|nr:hypothetical protein Ahy_A07g033016 [Arachis hypogaea]